MTSVGEKRHTPPSRVEGLLLTTSHSSGAVTVRVKRALMSGWSKQAKTRWAS